MTWFDWMMARVKWLTGKVLGHDSRLDAIEERLNELSDASGLPALTQKLRTSQIALLKGVQDAGTESNP